MKKINILKNQTLVLFLVACVCVNMGMGGDKTNTVKEPGFSMLDEGLKSYRATIIDDNKPTEIKDLSVAGKTNFVGIRRENDNSVMEIDFSKIKELEVKNKAYYSERFSDKEFILIDCTTMDGSRLSNLLFPRNLVISAVSVKPEVRLAWYLRDLQKIIFQGAAQPTH